LPMIAWMLFPGCHPPGDPAPNETADSSTPGLPGTTERVPEEQILGVMNVEWLDMEHLLPGSSKMQLSAAFWEQAHFDVVYDILLPAEGLDTCEAYLVSDGGGTTLVAAQAGELTVRLDEEIWFQGPPNTGSSDAVGYYESRAEPAWGSTVGVSAAGEAAIPPFDLPLVGWMPSGPVGQVTPGHGENVSLQGLTLTWDNPLGGELELTFTLGYVNFICRLTDDGQWQLPNEYLALLDDQQVTHALLYLNRGSMRWIPISDEKYLQVLIRAQTSWRLDVLP
jgi:hypothetical protein